jgi:hypothetical protein
MPVVNISIEASEKFKAIMKSRPQDAKAAQTFDHILYVYEEQSFRQPSVIKTITRVVPSKVTSPIIDADKLQNEGEKL